MRSTVGGRPRRTPTVAAVGRSRRGPDRADGTAAARMGTTGLAMRAPPVSVTVRSTRPTARRWAATTTVRASSHPARS